MRSVQRLSAILAFLALGVFFLACRGADSGDAARAAIDADPFGLLPAGALVIASLDARTMAAAPASVSLAAITDAIVPFGQDAGFVAERDVDRIVIAAYGPTGVQWAGVMTGRFDATKLASATRSKRGIAVVAGGYVGFPTYAVGTLTVAPLTAQTLVSGTRDGVMRVLERVHDGKIRRAMPGWAVETLTTPGAEVAVMADFSAQPIASVMVGSVTVPWLTGMRIARVLGDFRPPGMNFAATLTYADAPQAESAAEGVHLVDGWLKLFAPLVGGMSLENLEVTTDASDLRCKFAVSDRTLRTLVSLAPRLLPAQPQ